MNTPNNRDYRTDEQYPAEEQFEQHPRFAPDAPPLRADEYDPVWVGQHEAPQIDVAAHRHQAPAHAPRQPADLDEETISQDDLDRLEQIIASEQFRIRRRQAPAFMPPPPPVKQKRAGIRWAIGTFALLLVSSSVIALQVTDRVPILESTNSEAGNQVSRLASLLTSDQKQGPVAEIPSPAPAKAQAPMRDKPRLVVNGASADSPDQILLGVGVEGSTDGVSAVVSGLAPGTTLSAGKAWGATGWIVPASEVATTYLRPPAGFSGMMEYSVALQLADNSVIERQTMRLEWAGPAAADQSAQPAQEQQQQQQQAQSPSPAPQAPQGQTVRRLDPSELALILRRGEDLLREGDVASARLLLQRAAEAQDARAALALAASYDPAELKRMGVYGAAPDLAKARDWYEKARQYGSREAPRRLELLASQYR